MKPTAFYFCVELPGTGMALTWIGGGLKPSKRPDRVWLTTPGGEPVLEVLRQHVHARTREQTAQRIMADLRASRAPRN
jgi:hypothetical protein